jgi:hypothetical protein
MLNLPSQYSQSLADLSLGAKFNPNRFPKSLVRACILKWCGRRDLNPGLQAWKAYTRCLCPTRLDYNRISIKLQFNAVVVFYELSLY